MAGHQFPPDIDITIVSAKDLKNINWFHGDLRPYACAWVDPASKVTTRVDDEGDTDPKWGETFTIPVTRNLKDAVLTVEIYQDKAKDPKKAIVGTVTLPLQEVADAGGFNEKLDYSLKLRRPSGRPHGKVQLGIKLREKLPPPSSYPTNSPYGQNSAPYGQNYYPPPDQHRDWQAYPGYSQYPPPYAQGPPPASYGQAPPPSGYGQPYAAPNYAYGPPAPSYGTPRPSFGTPSYPSYGQSAPYSQPAGSSAYGMPPQVQAPAQKGSKFGGMGAGLAIGAVAGGLGGLALGEYVEHEEKEAAEDQADEDADRYAELEAARDDYGGGNDYGGGDDY